MTYNPIVRNFCRLRRSLMEAFDLPRCAIRPNATFAELVPRERRRHVIELLRKDGIDAGNRMMSRAQIIAVLSVIAVAILLAWLLYANCWIVLMGAIAVGIVAIWTADFWAAEFDPSLTLGDIVLAMTSMKECREAGYRPTQNEIAFKVREIIANGLGVLMSEITTETNWVEMCD